MIDWILGVAAAVYIVGLLLTVNSGKTWAEGLVWPITFWRKSKGQP